MKALIVEDEFMARNLLNTMLIQYGTCDMAVNFQEVLTAVTLAYDSDSPYDVICLDISLESGPDGLEILRTIRQLEVKQHIYGNDRVKIIMITANNKPKDILNAFSRGECDAYMVKPVLPAALAGQLKKLDVL
jgi:two-component system chemotaxis response regulator CheY